MRPVFRVNILLRAICVCGSVLVAGDALGQAAMRGEVQSAPARGFARLILRFPEPVTARVEVAGGVLILRFDRSVDLTIDRLAIQLPAYVSAARLDPDRRALRIALTQAVRADLKDAAEDLYLDLVPAAWRGGFAPLPADVVAKLAARVRARRVAEGPAAPARAQIPVIPFAFARTDQRIRLTFSLPAGVTARAGEQTGRTNVYFEGAARLDPTTIRAAAAGVLGEVDVSDDGRSVAFAQPPGLLMTATTEDGAFVVDLAAPSAALAAMQLPKNAAPAAKVIPAPEELGPHPPANVRGSIERATTDTVASPATAAPVPRVTDAVFDAEAFAAEQRGDIRQREYGLIHAAADAPKRERTQARLQLMHFHLANARAAEARGLHAFIASEDPKVAVTRSPLLMLALACVMSGDDIRAARILSDGVLALEPEAEVLRAIVDARAERFAHALQAFRTHAATLDAMPDLVQAIARPLAISAALAVDDDVLASHHLAAFEQLEASTRDPAHVLLFRGRIAQARGRNEEAIARYDLAGSPEASRPIEAEARLRKALLQQATGALPLAEARKALETIAMIWRKGAVEVSALARLAEMASAEGRWRDAFLAMRRAVEIQPDHPVTRDVQDEMQRRFEALFLGGETGKLSKIEALAIFEEFRALIPPGAKGDAIVRRLSERLVDLDLLDQAGDLLSHQVEHRLKGAEKAEVAADLAALRLAQDRPKDALDVLKASRFSAAPTEVKRLRLHLEARALSDLQRTDVALELLGAEQGPEVERLRGEILWRGKRWNDCAETYERALDARAAPDTPLEAGERADALRAAVAYGLASDHLGLGRLRDKYLAKIDKTPDGELFQLVTAGQLSQSDDFGEAARRAVSARNISDLLTAYRKRFVEPATGQRAG